MISPIVNLEPGSFWVARFVSPVMFSIYGINVYSYGVFVALALLAATIVFGHDLQLAGLDLDEVKCFFIFLAGFAIGSKGHMAIQDYADGQPFIWQKAIDVRSGHSFIGSQIGAVGLMLMYIRYHRISLLQFLDTLLPCCLLGHAIGKLGCFFSGDGCYGPPADPRRIPWAMSFPNASFPTELPVHPTPLYELVCSFAVFCLARRYFDFSPKGKLGRRTSFVLVVYGIDRVIMEHFRRHPPIQMFGGLTEYQALALGLLGIGLAIELWSYARPHRGRRQQFEKGKVE